MMSTVEKTEGIRIVYIHRISTDDPLVVSQPNKPPNNREVKQCRKLSFEEINELYINTKAIVLVPDPGQGIIVVINNYQIPIGRFVRACGNSDLRNNFLIKYLKAAGRPTMRDEQFTTFAQIINRTVIVQDNGSKKTFYPVD